LIEGAYRPRQEREFEKPSGLALAAAHGFFHEDGGQVLGGFVEGGDGFLQRGGSSGGESGLSGFDGPLDGLPLVVRKLGAYLREGRSDGRQHFIGFQFCLGEDAVVHVFEGVRE
jgi:hypothetical protein